MTGTAALSTRNLRVGYRNRTVIDNLDIGIGSGEFLALIGANGAGKTTLIRTLAGLLPPLSGEVLLEGRLLGSCTERERALKIAYVSQTAIADWPYTVREVVRQGRFPHRGWIAPSGERDRAVVESAMDRTGLSGFGERLVTELSGGELQRALIARALATEANILILDEPVSHLDIRYQVETLTLLRALAKTGLAIVASLHELNLVSLYVDRVAILSRGELLAEGSPGAVLTADTVEKAFGIAVGIGRHPGYPNSPLINYPGPSGF